MFSGATLAISLAAITAQNGEPAYGLITLVPLTDTDPDLTDKPWGENQNSLGLTPDRLLGDLKTTFEEKHPDSRDHWHSNPCKMSDEAIRLLPSTIMVVAKLDILYRSQTKFKNRLQAQGVEVDWLEVDGLHYVKDMDKVTEAGRAVRQYIKHISIEYAEHTEMSTKKVGNGFGNCRGME